MIRKIVRFSGWTAAVLAGLAAALYLVVLAVNWRDREPSDATARLDELARPAAVADSDNAFIYAMGFDAPAGEDPAAAGLRRVEWIRSATAAGTFDRTDDPLPERTWGTVDPPDIRRLRDSCREGKAECVVLSEGSTPALEEWVAAQGSLLERYRQLIAHSAWQERVSLDFGPPLPTYSYILAGQRLLLFHVFVLVKQGDAALAEELLASDLRFWRTVLGSSDLLITKMTAATAIGLHFEWGTLAMRDLRGASAAAAVPDEWRIAFTATDFSVRRTIAGEWAHLSQRISSSFGLSAGATFADKAFAPLYQRQDTLNRFADYYWRAAEILDVPLDGYPEAVRDASRPSENARIDGSPSLSLYNPVGTALMAGGPVDFGAYAARAADVEGMRRGALAAVSLHADGVPAADVPAALRTTAARNPYDGEPLLWDESRNAIVFRGLEPSPRGEHVFYY